ncbi:MAG: hypothetical protein ABIG95_03025 [Candidatus Woesearchaeota archaeon]
MVKKHTPKAKIDDIVRGMKPVYHAAYPDARHDYLKLCYNGKSMNPLTNAS